MFKKILTQKQSIVMVSIVLAILIFLADAFTPLGLAVSFYYLLVIVSVSFARRPVYLIQFALVCSGLCVAAAFLSPVSSEVWISIINRGMAILAMWITVLQSFKIIAVLNHTQIVNAQLRQQKEGLARSKRAALSMMEDANLAKDKALAAEKRVEQVIESTPSGMIMVNSRGHIVLVNRMTTMMFGYSLQELIGQPLELLIPKRHRDKHSKYRTDFFKNPETREMGAGRDLFGLRKDKVEFPVEIGLNPVTTDEGHYVLASVINITGRKRFEKDIKTKNQELETLLYIVSHDLKEPLRSIEYFSSWVRDSCAATLDAKGQDYLGRVGKASQRMKHLLEDILMVSRARRIVNPNDIINGKEIVDEAILRLGQRVRETGAKVKIGDSFFDMKVERIWATQAVYNLVSNALKFTREGSPPEIDIKGFKNSETGEVGIMVSDRGPGVKQEYGQKIFELFQRAVDRDIEGTGAGLAIVKEVAMRHGGRAWCQPREGGGSEFVITFNEGAASGV